MKKYFMTWVVYFYWYQRFEAMLQNILYIDLIEKKVDVEKIFQTF